MDALLLPFCVHLACSPHACVGSLWEIRFPPTLQDSKDMQVWLMCELHVGVNVNDCLSLWLHSHYRA